MPRSKLGYRGKYYLHSFTGMEGTAALMQMFDIKEEVDAVTFGNLLMKRKILHHVTG
jgi:hypothetical protein